MIVRLGPPFYPKITDNVLSKHMLYELFVSLKSIPLLLYRQVFSTSKLLYQLLIMKNLGPLYELLHLLRDSLSSLTMFFFLCYDISLMLYLMQRKLPQNVGALVHRENETTQVTPNLWKRHITGIPLHKGVLDLTNGSVPSCCINGYQVMDATFLPFFGNENRKETKQFLNSQRKILQRKHFTFCAIRAELRYSNISADVGNNFHH